MLHFHDHDDPGHDHGRGDDHHQAHRHSAGRGRRGLVLRLATAALVLLAAAAAAASVVVGAGQALVITQFGDPVRVLTKPGLAWKWPAPVQAAVPVDMRLRTTSSGMHDVGTRDGLRILVEAYIVWRVPADAEAVKLYLRSVRNDPDEAARQLRSLVGSALQVTASAFDLADLVNTDRSHLRLAQFEERLRQEVAASVRKTYGIDVSVVGIERLSLPEQTLAATVARMRAERETVAAARTSEGLRQAAEIRSEASRDARLTQAKARTDAAELEASSRREAAGIYARAYERDPQLYLLIRSLDALTAMVNSNTRIVLRTDAAPFSVLIGIPAAPEATPKPEQESRVQSAPEPIR